MLNETEVKKEGNGVQMFLPFMSHHEWYGFEDRQALVHFLEDGAYDGDVIIDEEDIKLLPAPRDGLKLTKIKARSRGNSITQISVPVKEVVKTQAVKVNPVMDADCCEMIADDIAQGCCGG